MRKTLILLESFPHLTPLTLSSLLSCYIRDQWRPEAPALAVVQGLVMMTLLQPLANRDLVQTDYGGLGGNIAQ